MINKLKNKIISIIKTPDIRKRLVFTLVILLFYRLLSVIPLPAINGEAFKQYFGSSPFGNIFSIVTGGRLDNPSIVAIGLGPYINASVALQLLKTVIPKLDELSKEGERGNQVINQYTRILTVPLTIIQGFMIYSFIKSRMPELVGNPTWLEVTALIASLCAGTVLLMWFSELISESGLGNGSSFIIFTGIVASLPALVSQDLKVLNFNRLLLVAVFAGLILMVAGIVYVTEAVRKVPIQYARRMQGRKLYGGGSSYLPLKINQAGVMPVIFASSLLSFPQILTQFFSTSSNTTSIFYKISEKVGMIYTNDYLWVYNLIYFLLIMGFTFFYTFVVLNPNEQADNLKKSGGFIPGIRPGTSTAGHIRSIMVRLTVIGALFLAVVALIPSLMRRESSLAIFSGIGGTSILIIVGVILDTVRQIKSMVVARSYEEFN